MHMKYNITGTKNSNFFDFYNYIAIFIYQFKILYELILNFKMYLVHLMNDLFNI